MSAEGREISVVIVSWNTKDLLCACLDSLFSRDHGVPLEVIVVDNFSGDGSADGVAARFKEVRLIRNADNRGYAAGVNQGLEIAQAPWIVLLGSDTEIRGDALLRLQSFLKSHGDYGAAAPKLQNRDGGVQRSCHRLPTLAATFLNDTCLDRWLGGTEVVRRYRMLDFDHLSSIDVEQPQSSCLMLRREVVTTLGGFDERLFVFYNDVDYCRRMKQAGFRIRFLAEAEVVHHQGRSTAQLPDFVAELNVNRVRYFRKHHGILGVITVKGWTLLKGVEEALRIAWNAPHGTRRATLRRLSRTMAAILKA